MQPSNPWKAYLRLLRGCLPSTKLQVDVGGCGRGLWEGADQAGLHLPEAHYGDKKEALLSAA